VRTLIPIAALLSATLATALGAVKATSTIGE
jgi:hypothetical protein